MWSAMGVTPTVLPLHTSAGLLQLAAEVGRVGDCQYGTSVTGALGEKP